MRDESSMQSFWLESVGATVLVGRSFRRYFSTRCFTPCLSVCDPGDGREPRRRLHMTETSNYKKNIPNRLPHRRQIIQ